METISGFSTKVPQQPQSDYGHHNVVQSPFFPALYPRDITKEHLIICNDPKVNRTRNPCRIRVIFTDFQVALASTMAVQFSNKVTRNYNVKILMVFFFYSFSTGTENRLMFVREQYSGLLLSSLQDLVFWFDFTLTEELAWATEPTLILWPIYRLKTHQSPDRSLIAAAMLSL